MKKWKIKIINNDVSSKDVCEFLKNTKSSDKTEIFFDNGNIIKVFTDLSYNALNNELNKNFKSDFEIREIDE